MEHLFKQILDELQELRKGQASLNQKVDENFDELNGKYSSLNQKFDDLNGKYSNLDQKFDVNFSILNNKLDKLSEQVRGHHLENLKSDDRLIREILSLKSNVTFINRKVADTELEINSLKHGKQ